MPNDNQKNTQYLPATIAVKLINRYDLAKFVKKKQKFVG